MFTTLVSSDKKQEPKRSAALASYVIVSSDEGRVDNARKLLFPNHKDPTHVPYILKTQINKSVTLLLHF